MQSLRIYSFLFLTLFLYTSFTSPSLRILFIGDSISIGYFPYIEANKKEKWVLKHNEGNAMHTGIGIKYINHFLGRRDYKLIFFNWGLWDLCYRSSDPANPQKRDKENGKVTWSIEEYSRNLEQIVLEMKSTNAKLVFIETTFVPENEPGRFPTDAIRYNTAAKKIMDKYRVDVLPFFERSKIIHQQHTNAFGDVHFTDQGYQELANILSNKLDKKLKFP